MQQASEQADPATFNADLECRAVVYTQGSPWLASPMPGVWRKRLERDAGEPERVTTVVRYEAGSRFRPHPHPGGEEFLVLEGTFSDERGDYPAGTYVRNPPGSVHAPFSEPGCTILVKLEQFEPGDGERVVVDTCARAWQPGLVEGLSVQPLHAFGPEQVALVRWAPGTVFHRHVHPGGEEIYVLEGVFSDEEGDYPAGTWLRNPAWSAHAPFSREGCLIYVKVGHLPRADPSGAPDSADRLHGS